MALPDSASSMCNCKGNQNLFTAKFVWTIRAPSLKKRCFCAVSYGCFILHSLYKSGMLVYAYFFLPDVQLHQMIIHAIDAIASVMCAYWYYVEYIKDPPLFAAYVKATLTGNIGGGPIDMKGPPSKHWTKRSREYSMQDLIAMGLNYMVWPAIPIICSTYVYDSSMKLLLYAAIPPQLQNWAVFGLLLIEEARFLMVMVTLVSPTWQLQVISFDLVCTRLQLLMQNIQNNVQSPSNVYRTFRRLQLYVSMVNNVNGYMIFTWKLFCISVCIVSGYAAIAHFSEHPVFGFMYYFQLIDCGCLYTMVYGKAFKIPQLFEQAASCAVTCIRRNGTDPFRRQIQSVRRSGIRVGEFHHVERASTVIFMDYVVTNIVSMLVAFR